MDPSTSDASIEAGARLDAPLWLVTPLASQQMTTLRRVPAVSTWALAVYARRTRSRFPLTLEPASSSQAHQLQLLRADECASILQSIA